MADRRAVAALPMYDWPDLYDAHDTLWSLVRDACLERGLAAPRTLSRDVAPMQTWCHPNLLLGQICSLPWRARLRGRLRYVGTLDYALPGAAPGYYYSQLVVRRGARVGGVLAVNEALSHSGWAAAQGTGFTGVAISGAHLASARMVAEGRADMAAIDAVSWRALLRFAPEVAKALHVAGRSAHSPGLSLVTSGTPAQARALHGAVTWALDRLPERARSDLGIAGLVRIDTRAILDQPVPPPCIDADALQSRSPSALVDGAIKGGAA